MPCGCQNTCGCTILAGAGISVAVLPGGTFQIANTLGTPPAADVTYDNTTSGLTADDVQEAIDELAAMPAPVPVEVFQFENADATIDPATTIAVATDFVGPGALFELPPAIAGAKLRVWNNDGTFLGNLNIVPAGGDTWHYSAAAYSPTPEIFVGRDADLYCQTDGEWIVHVTY